MDSSEKMIVVQPYYDILKDHDVFRLLLPRAVHPIDYVFSSKTPVESLKEGLLGFMDAIFKVR